MAYAIFRPLRRLITKRFGGFRKFLLVVVSVAVIVYTLKSLFINEEYHVWDVNTLSVNKSNICDVKCLPNQLSFYINTGEKTPELGKSPNLCFQGKLHMSADLKNIGRGLNVLVANSKTRDVKSTHVFDTYTDESAMLRFLKKDVKDDDIILMATFDDASLHLKEAGRHWLKLYGSSLIKKIGFRDNFIMIGHRGLTEGGALEFHKTKRGKKDDSFAPMIEKAGCFSFPLGHIINMDHTVPAVMTGKKIQVGGRLENCGIAQQCPQDTVAVAVDTGQANTKKPTICVGNTIIIGNNVNDAGRGFNVVALRAGTLEAYMVTHMDTYTYDSTDLEIFLDSLAMGDIVIATIADDAAKKLGQSARDALNRIGSGQIQNLRFRDVWYFIGQVGISGFTTMEQLSFSAFDGSWPKPLTGKYCVPRILPSSKIMIEPERTRNDKRRAFCLKYEGYTDFCNPAKVDEELVAIPVSTMELKGHMIFETPIIIVPGMNHNAFVHTLETTLMQPGINQDHVSVLWDEKLPEYSELASMFGFKNYSLYSSSSYSDQMMKALKLARLVYPSADHMIFLEEDLLLSPDFMPFMARCLTTINSDTSLAGAFAWNINGFDETSGDSSKVYRVQEFPGLGFLMKANIIKNLVSTHGVCCKNRAWSGWQLPLNGLEMLMPDVSRVYRTPFYGAAATSEMAKNLFLKTRRTHLDLQVSRLDLGHLITSLYDDFLKVQIIEAQVIKPLAVSQCVLGHAAPPDLMNMIDRPVVIFYAQETSEDLRILVGLCRCFGLVAMDGLKPKNMHNGLLRFYSQRHDVYLVGSLTPYFTLMNSSDNVLSEYQLSAQYHVFKSPFVEESQSQRTQRAEHVTLSNADSSMKEESNISIPVTI